MWEIILPLAEIVTTQQLQKYTLEVQFELVYNSKHPTQGQQIVVVVIIIITIIIII